MICHECGAQNTDDSLFCMVCGSKLIIPEATEYYNQTGEDNPAVCPKCGSAIHEGCFFCETCGHKLEQQVTPNINYSADPVQVKENPPKEKKGKKGLVIAVVIGCAVIIAVVVGVILFFLNRRPQIDLNKYIKIETSGYDGFGTAVASIDFETMRNDYGDEITLTTEVINQYGLLSDLADPYSFINSNVDVALSDYSGLSNGQEINYKWNVSESLDKYVNCDLVYDDGVYIVENLEKIGTFDAFKDLTVEFTGIEPNGKANLNYSGKMFTSYDFQCDRIDGLSNGETIRVWIDESDVEQYARSLGKIPSSFEKEYTVSGLTRFIRSADEIPSSEMDLLKGQAEDDFSAYVAKKWGDGEKLESLTYIGNYLLTSKSNDGGNGTNYLFLIYKAKVHNTYETYDQINDIYWFIRFNDIKLNSDNKLDIDITEYRTPSKTFKIDSGIRSGFLSSKTWKYNGYETLDDLYKDVVMSYVDVYNHIDNIDESAAPKTPKANPTPADKNAEEPQLTVVECESISASGYYVQDKGKSNEVAFIPELAIDGDIKTAWNVRAHYSDEDGDGEKEKITTYGVGEYLDFEFIPGTKLRSVTICPGFCYDNSKAKRFERNYAPTLVEISVGDQSYDVDLSEYAYDLNKASKGCVFEFPDWVELSDGKLRITIKKVRNMYAEQGLKDPWNDCCISEVSFMGAT